MGFLKLKLYCVCVISNDLFLDPLLYRDLVRECVNLEFVFNGFMRNHWHYD